MNRKLVLIILVIVASGSIGTLVSGCYEQELFHGLGSSITGYGFPLSWYKKIVIIYTGEPARYEFDLQSFLLDISFWSLIIGVIATVVSNFLKQRDRIE